MKLSNEAYTMIMDLLSEAYESEQGHEDRQEEINTVMGEVEAIGTL